MYNKTETKSGVGGDTVSESEIIELLHSHKERGLELLMKHYGALMRYIITPILPDERDREECISDVAVRVWENISSYSPDRGTWCAWLTAVTRNTAINRVKRNRNAHITDLSDDTDIPAEEPTPEEAVLRREAQLKVSRAVEQLSNRDRILIYRKYYYMQPTSQIASELGLSERAVEGRLYRIRRRLQKDLGGDLNG